MQITRAVKFATLLLGAVSGSVVISQPVAWSQDLIRKPHATADASLLIGRLVDSATFARRQPAQWRVSDVQGCPPASSAHSAYALPGSVRQRAAQAIAIARQWSADAQLSRISVRPRDYAFILQFEILSPQSGQGLWIGFGRCSTAQPQTRAVGRASWQRRPLPLDFLEFDQALAIAGRDGLAGQFDHASLAITDRNFLVWQISRGGGGNDVIIDATSGQTYSARQAYTPDGILPPRTQSRSAASTPPALNNPPAPDWSGVTSPSERSHAQQLHEDYMHNCPPSQHWTSNACEP